MMLNRRFLLLTGILFFCMAGFLSGADKKAKKDITVSIEDKMKAEDAAKNKKQVINQLMKLFLDRKPPVLLSTQKHAEAAPEFSIINGTDGMATLIYRCRYIDPEYLTDALDTIVTDAGTVELVKKLGSEVNEYSKIVIHDKAEKMEEIKGILLSLDKLQPQVLVEAQIIEIYSDQGAERDFKVKYTYYDAKIQQTNEFGMNLTSPTQNYLTTSDQGAAANFIPFSTGTTSDGSHGELSTAIRMLNTSSNARVLSAPNIIADQGAEATITTAEELPIPETAALSSSTNLSFKFKQVGVTLKITPELINSQTVQLSVSPQVRSVLTYQSFKQDNTVSDIPVISVRSIDTRLTVSDGDIIILGGLYNSEKQDQLRKIPYVGDIPVVGDLVNGRDSSTIDKQLLFLLKVHIVHPTMPRGIDPEATARDMHQASWILEQSRTIFTNKPASEFYDVEANVNVEAVRRKEAQAQKRLFNSALFEILMEKMEKQEDGKTEDGKTKDGKTKDGKTEDGKTGDKK